MNILNRLRGQPRRRMVIAGTLVAVLIGGGIAAAAFANAPSGVRSAVPTPTASPEPEPVAVPTVNVAATFDGWSQEHDEDVASHFTAEAGDPSEGSIALRMESTGPATNNVRRVLSQIVTVTPSTTYTFTADVKSAAGKATKPSVAVIMGTGATDRFDFPTVSAAWTETEWAYETGADETSLPVSLLSLAPTAGTSIDNIAMTVKGTSENLLANGSFESFAAPGPQITNASLFLPTGEAALGVSWRIPGASWTLTDEAGVTVEQGTVDLNAGLAMVSLQGLPAGYYSIDIANNENADQRIQSSLAIVDPLTSTAALTEQRFGAGIHLTPPYLNSGQVAADIGITSVRTDGKWNSVEKEPGKFTFPELSDVMLQNYTDHGVDYLPISNYGNKFYDGGFTPSSPAAIEAYGVFTEKMVSHFESSAVEIYNEFNHPPMNKGKCGVTPACYMPLLQSAAAAVKANHPETLIVGPAIAHQDDAWLTGLYQAGGLQYLDAVSFHPYDYSVESGPEFLEASLQQAAARIKEYSNGVTKPIWITELGWSTAGYSEQDQADNVVRAEVIAFAHNVERFYWYDLVNDESDVTHHEGNFGLVRQATATVPAFAPKPSGVAQAVLIRQISGKSFTTRDTVADLAVHSYAFGAGSASTRVAWATTPTIVSFAASDAVTSTDQFGASTTITPVDGRITVQLTGHPVYLSGNLKDMQKTI